MRKRKLLWLFIPLILLFSIYLIILLEVDKNALKDSHAKSDVIIVLGAKAKINNKINVCLGNRVKQGVQLYKNGFAPKLIFSGGNDQAEAMKHLAVTLDTPSEDILVENASLNTYENLVRSKRIMDEKHFNSAIIVSDAFHELRASLIADKLGIKHTVSPAIHSPCWTNGKYFSLFTLREPLAIIVYKLQNKL